MTAQLVEITSILTLPRQQLALCQCARENEGKRGTKSPLAPTPLPTCTMLLRDDKLHTARSSTPSKACQYRSGLLLARSRLCGGRFTRKTTLTPAVLTEQSFYPKPTPPTSHTSTPVPPSSPSTFISRLRTIHHRVC
ncbi:hypothetical protein DPEC_G00216760 [Dallia pectoralis]|uniref:Uncharacterized protein n=1 Tax=Dallia pectoralis TaxID=75939 RepID=A0ACC2G309_DALPE|nr:hypothetical protein DPEC_G00216760 [Dallia pectoralis]